MYSTLRKDPEFMLYLNQRLQTGSCKQEVTNRKWQTGNGTNTGFTVFCLIFFAFICFTVHAAQFVICSLWFAVHSSRISVHGSQLTVMLHNSCFKFLIHSLCFTVHASHSWFTFHASHFTVHDLLFTLHTLLLMLHISHFKFLSSQFMLQTSFFAIHVSQLMLHSCFSVASMKLVTHKFNLFLYMKALLQSNN